jgi:hypothetical protein
MKIQVWYKSLLAITIAILITACSNDKKENAIARVYDNYLYKDDVKSILNNELTKKDSALLVKSFINSWIEKNIELKKAEENLTATDKDVQQQLDDYRISLINYKYENAFVNEKLDTVVSNQEIVKYYNENSSNFELKDNIIKVLYVKIKRESPMVNKFKKLFKVINDKNKKTLEDLSVQYADNYYFKEDAWLLFDDLLKEIPIKTYDKEQFLQNNRSVEIVDADYVYLVNIIDFKIKESISPLAFEKQNIRNIILNKRKIAMIQQLRKELRLDAENKREIEIY